MNLSLVRLSLMCEWKSNMSSLFICPLERQEPSFTSPKENFAHRKLQQHQEEEQRQQQQSIST